MTSSIESSVEAGRSAARGAVLSSPGRRAGRSVPRLARLTTAGVGGEPAWFVEPATLEACAIVLAAARARGSEVRVLGGGTNVLAMVAGVSATVLSTRRLTGYRFEDFGVRVAAGMPLGKLVRAAAELGRSGLEVLAGIPGTVGGAVVGNSGTRHGAIGDVLGRVRILDADGSLRWVDRDGVRPAYRSTSLGDSIVLEAELVLGHGRPEDLKRRVAELQTIRKSTQPTGGGMVGCFFKNPPGDSAGRLIDRAGLKKERVGGAFVSDVHANFLMNDGTASAADLLALARRVRARVRGRHGVVLEPEVRIWGARRDPMRDLPGESGIPRDPA